MNFELSLYRQQLRETWWIAIKQLLMCVLAVGATIGSYLYLDSPEREIILIISGFSSIISMSYLPHIFKRLIQLRISIRNSTHSWVIRDKRGRNIASYPTLDAMKKDNPGVFKPQANRERYTIFNTETGKVGGVIIYEEHYQWKPTRETEDET